MKQTVLLAVTGMSPAILTETVWALATREKTIPARIIAVTTGAGRDRLSALWKPDPALGGLTPWNALREGLQASGHDIEGLLRFGDTPDDIRVITAHDHSTGRSFELEDIRTAAENTAAADFLLEQVRGIVSHPDTCLVASIAGGRKTMGTLLYAAVSLLGRDTDRVTHVLVEPPFETMPGFWFPGQPAPKSRAARGKSKALTPWVELADIPFVPLRRKITDTLGREPGSFLTLTALCRKTAADSKPPTLSLSEVSPGCRVDGIAVGLGPREHSLLLLLCERVLAGDPPFADYEAGVDCWSAHRQVLHARRLPSGADWRSSCAIAVDSDSLRHDVSSIREKLRKAGPAGVALAKLLPTRGRFSLDLPAECIDLHTPRKSSKSRPRPPRMSH